MKELMKECLPENVKRLSDWSGIDFNEEHDNIMSLRTPHVAVKFYSTVMFPVNPSDLGTKTPPQPDYTVKYENEAAHSSQLTAHSTQHTAHSTQHTAHSAQHTAHSTQHTAHRDRKSVV